MSIDTETARRVAKLARIKVEDEDLPALAGEFNAILGFVEQLNEVDIDGVGDLLAAGHRVLVARERAIHLLGRANVM